jgi:hypothetical protein
MPEDPASTVRPDLGEHVGRDLDGNPVTVQDRLDAISSVVAEVGPNGIETDLGLDVGPNGIETDLGLDEVKRIRDRFLMVEKNLGSANAMQSHYFTGHMSRADAAAYWASQEYREDWKPVVLVDLDTGVRYTPEVTLRWEEAQ